MDVLAPDAGVHYRERYCPQISSLLKLCVINPAHLTESLRLKGQFHTQLAKVVEWDHWGQKAVNMIILMETPEDKSLQRSLGLMAAVASAFVPDFHDCALREEP